MGTRGFRFWYSGQRSLLATARRPRRAVDRHWASVDCAYTVEEAVERIERKALGHGLTRIARIDFGPARRSAADACADEVLVVFGLDADTSPVLQDLDRGRVELPLGFWVRAVAGSRTIVTYCDAEWLAAEPDLPDDLRHRLAATPALVDDALA